VGAAFRSFGRDVPDGIEKLDLGLLNPGNFLWESPVSVALLVKLVYAMKGSLAFE